MVFNSLTFLVFFACVLALDRLLRSWTARKAHLLLASYLFYAVWNPPLVILLWISTLVDWYAARGMQRASGQGVRRAWLALSLVANLGMLGFFKYATFLATSFAAAVRVFGIEYQAPELDIILPVGISFYTFQTLSYTLDVYRRNHAAWDSPLDFALYVTFFPQLVAGPIVRASDFHAQTLAPRRASAQQFSWGVVLAVFGLFQKVVLADGLFAPIVDQVYDKGMRAGFVDAWLGTIAFSGQIFCDFAGYSTCAIGVALCLGFHLVDNFDSPYAAAGFSDFWRRWHISLSTWLRDYLYIPLGGNRRGPVRTYVNLMATMLIGGLWHGTTWMFVIWGGLHGAYLCIERWIERRVPAPDWARAWPVVGLRILSTYACVCIAWVFFRAGDLERALHLSGAMLGLAHVEGGKGGLLGPSDVLMIGGLGAAMLGLHAWTRRRSLAALWSVTPVPARALILAAMMTLLCLSGGDSRAFIYFQF